MPKTAKSPNCRIWQQSAYSSNNQLISCILHPITQPIPFSARRTFERKGDKKQKPYVSMIRKVFCFRGIVYSESGCPLLDPAPFVPVREEDANCGRCVGFHRCAFNSSPCCIRSTIPSRAALLRTIISVFLQEAPDFQEGPSARLCPYHRFALSLRPKSISAAKSGRSIGTGASRTFAGHRDS